jgi:FkbH-like protein
MNLTTRRASEQELLAWSRHDDRAVWAFSVSDRFGSAGLTGIVGLAADGDRCHIIDFVLSCRVMGRRVEDSLVHVAVEWARARGMREVVAAYVPTAKNKPCHDYWKSSEFSRDAAAERFQWSADRSYPMSASIALTWDAPERVTV